MAFVVVVAWPRLRSVARIHSGPPGGSTRQEGGADQAEVGAPVYVVKPGDCCLSQIAERTGVDVDTLVELNPNLDPQAIHSGTGEAALRRLAVSLLALPPFCRRRRRGPAGAPQLQASAWA